MAALNKHAGAIDIGLLRLRNLRRLIEALRAQPPTSAVEIQIHADVPRCRPGEVVQVSGPGEAAMVASGKVVEALSVPATTSAEFAIEILEEAKRRLIEQLVEDCRGARSELHRLVTELESGKFGP